MSEFSDRFGEWASGVEESLKALSRLSGTTTSHGGIAGSARELFVRGVLEGFLPSATEFGSGQVLGSDGQLSKQVDIIVYRPDMPRLASLAQTALYLAEGVVAAIEVKSRLDRTSLSKALDNCLSVKRLPADLPPTRTIAGPGACTYIYGYRGYRSRLSHLKDVVMGWARQVNPSSLDELPEVIVTEGAVVVKNDHQLLYGDGIRHRLNKNPVFLAACDDNPLRWMLLHLLHRVSGVQGGPLPNQIVKYLVKRNAEAREALEARAEYWGTWERREEENVIVELQ